MARKSKRKQESAAETLDQLESMGDRFAVWVSENPTIVLGVAGSILLAASVWGVASWRINSAADRASAALAEVQTEYRVAMGANPDELSTPEPANPETAREVRDEYVGRFLELSAEYEGSPVSAIASLEAGSIQEALGDLDSAATTFGTAAESLDPNDAVRALLLSRMASTLEAAGSWSEAGQAFESASEVVSYPLRYNALADAARCYAEAGEIERALEVFARVETEAPDLAIPEHIESQLRELRIGRQSG